MMKQWRETQKREKTLVRILEQGIFGIASKAQTSKLAAWAAPGMGAIARRAVRSGSLQIAIFMFSARAGNISLAPIHFPPYLSALIPETSDQVPVPQIRSALPSSYPDVVYTHHRGKGLSAPLRWGQSRLPDTLQSVPTIAIAIDIGWGWPPPPQRVRLDLSV